MKQGLGVDAGSVSGDASHFHAAFSHPSAPHPPHGPQQPCGIFDRHLPTGRLETDTAATQKQ